MLVIRALILVLLGLVSRGVALAYLGFDLGLYLTVKIVRNDFYYWLPLEGILETVVSLVARIMVKVIVDFTSNGE